MSIRARLSLIAVVYVLFVGATGGVAFFAAHRTAIHLHRSELAHEELESYLKLGAQAAAMFTGRMASRAQKVDPSRTGPTGQDGELPAEIVATINHIRELILSEIRVVEDDADERLEIDSLRQMERLLQNALNAPYADDALGSGLFSAAGVESATEEFTQLIAVAIERERGQARGAGDRAQLISKHMMSVIAVLVPLGMLIGLALLGSQARRLHAALDALAQGSRRLAAGDREIRLESAGNDELAAVSRAFNGMAVELTRHDSEREVITNSLETRVAEATRELNQANAQLRELYESRQRFFADVSHELRTPITIIHGEADVALRGREKNVHEYKEALAQIRTQAAHLGALVTDLLFMARGDAGMARAQTQSVELTAIVAEACEAAGVLGRQHGVGIVLLDAKSAFEVHGDPIRLSQLLMILLDNAVQYSHPGDRISVVVGCERGRAIVQVIDTGIGIAAHDLDRVFERFYRGQDAIKLRAEGSGLGLPMAQAIALAHGGELTAAPTPGGGTTMTLRLPLDRLIEATG